MYMSSCPDPNNVVFDEFALNTQKLGLLLRLSRFLNSDLPHHPHQIHEQCICVFYPCTNNFNTKLTTTGKINRVQTFVYNFLHITLSHRCLFRRLFLKYVYNKFFSIYFSSHFLFFQKIYVASPTYRDRSI